MRTGISCLLLEADHFGCRTGAEASVFSMISRHSAILRRIVITDHANGQAIVISLHATRPGWYTQILPERTPTSPPGQPRSSCGAHASSWVPPEEDTILLPRTSGADTTRQEDGPRYRPPDGLRLSKNPPPARMPGVQEATANTVRTTPRELGGLRWDPARSASGCAIMHGPGLGPRLYSGRHLMKKQAKKLVLAKETVMSMIAVNGGSGYTVESACTGSGVVCSYSAPYYCPREPDSRPC